MPTPHELEVAKRQDVLRRHGNDFYVREVVELMDSDDTDAGEEDLPRDERTSARKARRARPRAAREAGEGRRGPRAGSGRLRRAATGAGACADGLGYGERPGGRAVASFFLVNRSHLK